MISPDPTALPPTEGVALMSPFPTVASSALMSPPTVASDNLMSPSPTVTSPKQLFKEIKGQLLSNRNSSAPRKDYIFSIEGMEDNTYSTVLQDLCPLVIDLVGDNWYDELRKVLMGVIGFNSRRTLSSK
jgi:hypothetical protein